MAEQRFECRGEIAKFDDELGIVYGWAIVSTLNGAEYVDKQGDAIPEHAMVERAAEFMLGARNSGEMHVEKEDGQVVFAFPLTADLAKGLDIESPRTGLLVGVRPSPEVYARVKSGELTQFSIGGVRFKEDGE